MDPIITGMLSSAAYDALKHGSKFVEPGFWGFIVETVDELGEKYDGIKIDVMKEFFFDEKIAKQIHEYRTQGTKIDFDNLCDIFEQICTKKNLTLNSKETLRDFFNYLESKLVKNRQVHEKIKLNYLQDIAMNTDKILEQTSALLQGHEELKSFLNSTKVKKNKIKLEPKPKYFKGEIRNFIGREKEIENVISNLRTSKVVAIVGEGGLGKSSLAIKAIHSCEDEFEIIIPLYLDLSLTLDDFLTEVSVRLMIPQEEFIKQTIDHKIEIIMNELTKRNKVLIFADNYETISARLEDSSPEHIIKINKFLESVPENVIVLLTSRQKNNLTNEISEELEGLTVDDGLSLFNDLASKNLRSQKDNNEIIEKIKNVLEKVGGHPLAIELLARSYKGKGLDELNSILSTIGIGVVNPRSSEQRLKSLEACFDYSIGFINTNLEELLLKLTIFNSSFPSKIVGKTFNTNEDWLEDLYEHSMLQRIEKDEFGDLEREFWLYDIHPVIRAYLHKKIKEKGIDTDSISNDQIGILFGEYLSELRDNLNSEKRGMMLRHFSLMTKKHPNDIDHYSELIDNENVRAQYFGLAAQLYHNLGLFKTSYDYYEKILSIFHLESFPENLIPILGNYSLLLSDTGNFERAIDLTKQIAQIYESKNDNNNAGTANDNIGLMLFHSGKRHDALPYSRKAIEQLEKTENKSSLATAYLNFGNVIREDDPEKSLIYLNKAKTFFDKLKDPRLISICYRDLASSYRKKMDYPQAIDCLNKALEIAEEQHEKLRIAITHLDFGVTYNVMKDFPNAKKHLEQCLSVFEEVNDSLHLIEYYIQMGQAFFGQRMYNEAMSSYQKAFNLAKELGMKNDLIRTGIILASGFLMSGYFNKAIFYTKFVIPIVKELKNPTQTSNCRNFLEALKKQFEEHKNEKLLNEIKELKKQLSDETDPI